jgi:hypothetical protein
LSVSRKGQEGRSYAPSPFTALTSVRAFFFASLVSDVRFLFAYFFQ